MEELIELENFKFETKIIEALFDAFNLEIKGNFTEKEIDNFKLKLKKLESGNINLKNVTLILSTFEEADDISSIF